MTTDEPAPMRTWTYPERHPSVPGPWDDEPDKAQWIDQATGLDCLVVRHPNGNLCGYVGVPPGHPWHGLDVFGQPHEEISVHGGLNYSALCADGSDGQPEPRICHVPEPGRPENVWWFGFDCGHAFDEKPILEPLLASVLKDRLLPDRLLPDGWVAYRDFGYVQREIAGLAAQLAAVATTEEATT